MAEMLAGLRQSYTSTAAADMQVANTQLEAIEQRSTASLARVVQSITDHDVEVTSAHRDMHNVVQQGKESITRQMGSAQDCGEEAVEKVQEVASTAGSKRDVLDTTVRDLSLRVDVAVLKAQSEVQITAETATIMLEDVKKASQKMDSTTSECMNDFVSYIDGNGDTLNSELNVHFTSLQSFLTTQDERLTQVREADDAFLQESQTDVVKSTGSTPEKKPFKSLQQIT